MEEIVTILSTREWAITIWGTGFFIWMLTQSEIRKSLWNVIKILLGKNLRRFFLIIALYVAGITMIFYQLPFWNNIYLKDIILWLIFSGISYCVNSIIKGDTEHLKSTVKDNFRVIVIFEYFIGTFTFKFWIEMLIIPVITILTLMNVVAESEEKYRGVHKLTNKVLHIFGDTTLEFPYTLEYKKRFKKNEESRGVRVLTAKNREKNFEDLCDIVGPPSRVMRWCCTVFKTGAIQKTISSAFKDKNNILSFQGIRHSESVSRSKYERESESPKISKQTVASPIIDWIDYDVWLYILTTGIDFNEAYRLGWTRVGCWCCPNNGGWSEFLAKVHMYDQYIHWHELLVNFAKKIGKPDPEEYINDGGWKARQGGNGLEAAQTSVVSFEPCATEEKAFNYELQRPITEELYELFKPFGYINKDLGNKRLGEVFVLNKAGKVVLILQGRLGSTKLKVNLILQETNRNNF